MKRTTLNLPHRLGLPFEKHGMTIGLIRVGVKLAPHDRISRRRWMRRRQPDALESAVQLSTYLENQIPIVNGGGAIFAFDSHRGGSVTRTHLRH